MGSSDSESKKPSSPVVPDGGYGWVICATCFLSAAVVDGLPLAFGIILESMGNELEVSRSSLALIPSLLLGMTEILGPLACLLINKWGLRCTSLVGGMLSSLAYLASGFATSLWMLYLTYGIMAGIIG